jgi:cytochrome c-type biogenesis protein CcmH/NrfG
LQLAGRLDAAAFEMRQAVARSVSKTPSRAHGLAWLAHVLLARGQAQSALDAAAESMRLLAELGGMDEGESQVRLAYAEALEAVPVS